MDEGLVQAMKQYGFECTEDNDCVFSTWDGYATSVARINDHYAICMAIDGENCSQKLKKQIDSQLMLKTAEKCRVERYGETGAEIALFDKTNVAGEITAYLSIITAVFRENGLVSASTCSICGQAQPDCLCFIEFYRPFHERCIEKRKNALAIKEQQSSYGKGLLGAFWGMILCVCLTAVFSSLWSAGVRWLHIVFALTPAICLWGYLKGNGRKTIGGVAIAIVASALAFGSMIFLLISYDLSKKQGKPLLEELMMTIRNPQLLTWRTMEIGLYTALFVAGIVGALWFFKNYCKARVEEKETLEKALSNKHLI